MILLVSYDTRRKGGIERLTLQARNSLIQTGTAVVLICPQAPISGWLGRQLGRLKFLLKLIWYLPQSELILCMHALMLRPIRLLMGVMRIKQPLFCWIHGVEVWGNNLMRVQSDLLASQQLIASSNYTRKQLQQRNEHWPFINVINPMADLMQPDEIPVAAGSGFRLLTVARMDAKERYKGHRLVLAALTRLKQHAQLEEDWQWRVVGEGDDRPNLQQQTHLHNLDPWVYFLGRVSDDQLRQELRQCSLLLMPSSSGIRHNGEPCGEGFGIVYLEAALAARASIACTEGGQTDLIVNGQTGWLIEENPIELAELLLHLSRNPKEIETMGSAARERAVSHFGEERFTRQLISSLCY
jgi:phosphatidylinositol alpha-1,6-mannosyltransferase